ncbi:uncharacterized protein LOC114530401 [Dendronephthya gigantea]|uniref:uncharacterized protein LOC114530401 n=1 Tax=Dendronephthya gigantea TaxID=151771 RepID=UPI00106A6CCC|nr:uncharacterized protein LOC114530401 [Dendronephthya gigantea]
MDSKITKAIDKLKYYLEEAEELIEDNDINELRIASKRTDQIRDELNDLISHVQELKLDSGTTTQRAIRQWKKDLKASFAPLLEKKEKINEVLENIEKKRFTAELQEREKALWEERLKAEIKMTKKKLEMETLAKVGRSKLPELKITPFRGTREDWIRFENMFKTPVDKKPISAEEKFGYLLELVDPKIRNRFANLKPGETGYLDTGSGRNFVSKEATDKLKLKPKRHETHNILTINGTKKQSMPVFDVKIESVDGSANKSIELTGSRMMDFTTVKRPTIADVKERYPHVREKSFYRTPIEEYQIHVILGDAFYCQIKTEDVIKEKSDYERLYSLNVLGIEDRAEDDQLDVYREFKENITM